MNISQTTYRLFSSVLLLVFCEHLPVMPAQNASSRPDIQFKSSAIPAKIKVLIQPVYPAEAKKDGIEGRVVVRIVCGRDGKVKLLRVEEGHPLLAKAANEAIRQWEFEPLVLNGEPVEFETTIEVIFTLKPDAKAPKPADPPASEPSAIPDLRILENKATPKTGQAASIVQQGELKKKVPPQIPKGLGVGSGPITLRFRITREGKVTDLEGLKGNPALLRACVAAVRQWEYEPTLVDGRPVEVETTLTLTVDWHYRIHWTIVTWRIFAPCES